MVPAGYVVHVEDSGVTVDAYVEDDGGVELTGEAFGYC